MRHPFEDDSYNIVHADVFDPKFYVEGKINLVENVRWRPDKPDRKGRFLKEINEIVENNPKWFICYDLSHAYISGEPMEEILKYASKIRMFHINDTKGKKDLHLIPMQGEIDFKNFFRILNIINYRGVLFIEP